MAIKKWISHRLAPLQRKSKVFTVITALQKPVFEFKHFECRVSGQFNRTTFSEEMQFLSEGSVGVTCIRRVGGKDDQSPGIHRWRFWMNHGASDARP